MRSSQLTPERNHDHHGKLSIGVNFSQRFEYQIHVTDAFSGPYFAQYVAGISETLHSRKIVVVSDSTVWRLHGVAMAGALTASQLQWDVIILPPGEITKSLDGARKLWEDFKRVNADRRTLVVGFGGGVICDTVGFCASAYLRGLPYILVPTTLMAQVDASIGGKVGVDFLNAKNWIGSFWHPVGTYVSTEFLSTLGSKEIASGFAELVKVGAIVGDPVWSEILQHVEHVGKRRIPGPQLLKRGITAKLELLADDPTEVSTLDRSLNFGHCIGHAVEAASRFRLRHGEAVAIGMAVATRIGTELEITDIGLSREISYVLQRYNLPVDVPPNLVADAWRKLDDLRQVRNGSLRLVIATAPGAIRFVDDISEVDFVESARRVARIQSQAL